MATEFIYLLISFQIDDEDEVVQNVDALQSVKIPLKRATASHRSAANFFNEYCHSFFFIERASSVNKLKKGLVKFCQMSNAKWCLSKKGYSSHQVVGAAESILIMVISHMKRSNRSPMPRSKCFPSIRMQ